MTTITVTWHWRDRWQPHPPPGWDGNHVLGVRGYGTVFETAGIKLTCSCGQEAFASDDDDEGGEISLDALNELAAAHLAEP